MTLPEIASRYSEHDHSKELVSFIESNKVFHVLLRGLHASTSALFASSIVKKNKHAHLFILSDKEKAAYFQNDLKEIFPKKDILFFPSSFKRSAIKSKNTMNSFLYVSKISITIVFCL